jgi:hypothetical protein
LLLGSSLYLNELQNGALQLAFKIFNDSSLLLLDMKDLRAMVYQGANRFFGKPMLDINDLMRTDADSNDVSNMLAVKS